MKLCTLLCVILFSLAANCQTKEAEIRKLEQYVKRAEGNYIDEMKIVEQSVKESRIKSAVRSKDGNSSGVYDNLNWEDFYFTIAIDEDNEQLSILQISFAKDADLTSYREKKQIEKEKTKQAFLYFLTADTRMVEKQVKELQTYTSKALNEIRIADKAQLVNYLTERLNKAMQDEKAKIVSITDCEISFTQGNQVVSIPTRNLRIEETEEAWAFGYGKEKTSIKIKEGAATKTRQVAQAPMNLSFEFEQWFIDPVDYAFRRLAANCR